MVFFLLFSGFSSSPLKPSAEGREKGEATDSILKIVIDDGICKVNTK